MPVIELVAAARWKPSAGTGRDCYAPGAPILRDMSAAAQKAPLELAPLAKKKDTSVFAGPNGTFFVFAGMPRATVTTWTNGRARTLDLPPLPWPYHHDFTDDGRYLFLSFTNAIRRVDLATGASVEIRTGFEGEVGAVAVAGNRLAVAMSERVVFLPVDGVGSGDTASVWFPWRFGSFVGAAAGRRLVLAGAQQGSWVFGVDGDRVIELARFARHWVSGVRDVKGKVRVSARAVTDARAATVVLPPLQALELRGADAAHEALFGAGRPSAVAVHEARAARARAEKRIAWVPARPAPFLSPPAGADVSRLTYVEMGPSGYGRGCTPYPQQDMHWIIHAIGPKGVAPIKPELACRRTGWSFHWSEPRALVANFKQLIEVDLAARKSRKLAEVGYINSLAAYFGGGAAALTDRELVLYARQEGKLVPARRFALPGASYEDRAIATLAEGRALMVRQGERTFVLGDRDGEVVVLGVANGGPPSHAARVGGKDFLFRDGLPAVEVRNLDVALARPPVALRPSFEIAARELAAVAIDV